MKLSIIIPAYNAEPYLSELLNCLAKQVTPEVEVVVVDDGSRKLVKTSHSFVKVIRKKNGGCASARNVGIENTTGEYISFIDADDIVSDQFVQSVLHTITTRPDVIELSWKSLSTQGTQHDYKLNSINDHLKNPSVCTRVFRREFIGDVRFNEKKDSTEDEDFSRKIGYLTSDFKGNRAIISDYMYFYRTAVENSKIKRFKQGKMNTKRVVYYYKHVTKNMTFLVDQIKKDDELNEVWLLTEKNDIPELARWCQIHKPMHMWTHFLKGEPYHNIEIIPVPYKTDVVLYINNTNVVGGIETFVYSFAKIMGEYYDITYVVNNAPREHIEHMQKVVKVIIGSKQKIICDNLIMLRILDSIPMNIEYKKSIQMCHACKTNKNWNIPQNCDYIVNVSQVSKDSFQEDKGIVIHNLIDKEVHKPLVLMSATRIPAADKGNNEKRMMKLASMLNDAGIEFMWLNFSDGELKNPPKGFHNMGLNMNASDYFGMATYIVQLSDSEAWSYTVLEALTQNIPVLVCPFPSAFEMGVEDGENGYILPYDMDFDIHKILNVPEFKYSYSNKSIVTKWKKILNAKPKPKPKQVKVRSIFYKYFDKELKRDVFRHEEWLTSRERAAYLEAKGLVKVLA